MGGVKPSGICFLRGRLFATQEWIGPRAKGSLPWLGRDLEYEKRFGDVWTNREVGTLGELRIRGENIVPFLLPSHDQSLHRVFEEHDQREFLVHWMVLGSQSNDLGLLNE